MYDKVDEQTANSTCGVTPVRTTWIGTYKSFEEENMQVGSRIVAREFKPGNRPDLYVGIPPMEGLKAMLSIAVVSSA